MITEIEAPALIETVTWRMLEFDKGDARRIQHLLKVHRFAALIARGELVDPATRFVIECAALVHDIGIHAAEEKYGCADGRYQEMEGPALAQELLTEIGLETETVARVAWLVGHHHTYSPVESIDHQILLEADMLVNLYEDGAGEAVIAHVAENLFRTATGKKLLTLLYT